MVSNGPTKAMAIDCHKAPIDHCGQSDKAWRTMADVMADELWQVYQVNCINLRHLWHLVQGVSS
jgi:hypothetical protein